MKIWILLIFLLTISCRPTIEKKSKKAKTSSLKIPPPKAYKGKTIPCNILKNGPLLVEACEGEGCFAILENGLLLQDKVVLYEKPDIKSKVLGVLKKCEPYRKLKSYLLIKKLFPAKVTVSPYNSNSIGIRKGDKVFITHSGGEGSYFVCLGDKVFSDWGDQNAVGLGEGEFVLEKEAIIGQDSWFGFLTDIKGIKGKRVYSPHFTEFNTKHEDPRVFKRECPKAELTQDLKKMLGES